MSDVMPLYTIDWRTGKLRLKQSQFQYKASRTALLGMLYGMSQKHVYALLLDRLQVPLPEEVSRWEDDGGAV